MVKQDLAARTPIQEKKFATAMARDVPIIPLIPPEEWLADVEDYTAGRKIPCVRVSLSGHFTSEYVPEVEERR